MAKGAVGSKGAVGAGKGRTVGSKPKPAKGRPVAAPEYRESSSSAAASSSSYEEKVLPTFDEDFADNAEMQEVRELAAEVVDLNARKKKIEDQIREKSAVINATMSAIKDESWSIRDEGFTVSFVKPGPRKTIVPERLIEQGVTWKQIEKATKLTPSTPFVTVRARSSREE